MPKQNCGRWRAIEDYSPAYSMLSTVLSTQYTGFDGLGYCLWFSLGASASRQSLCLGCSVSTFFEDHLCSYFCSTLLAISLPTINTKKI